MEKIIDKQNKKDMILKSNNLIDCSYKLTLSEQRILNIACKRLKPMFLDKNTSMNEFKRLAETLAFEPIEISISDYVTEYSVKSKNIYLELSKVASSLYEKEIIYFDEDDNLTRKRWVITCKYKENEGKIALKFHPDLVTDLLVFKGSYTQLNSDFLATARSFYASRLYELLRQYLLIGKRDFDLEELRFKFGLLDTEYPRYSNLKQKVINPSVEWVNDNTDILIDFEEDKCGSRSVKKLLFKISKKDSFVSQPSQLVFDFPEDNSAYKKIRDIIGINITAEQAEKICDSAILGLKTHNMNDVKSLDYIKEKWDVVQNYGQFKDRKEFNPIGALISALKNNWGTPNINISSSKKLKFNNFTGRDQDEEYYDDLEKKLLGWD